MSPARQAVRAEAVARIAAVVIAVLLVAFAAWQYAMPRGAWGPWGLNFEGVAHFRRTLGVPALAQSDTRFRAGLFVLLLSVCSMYVVFCATITAAGTVPVRTVTALGVVLALVMAVLCPPSLSTDVYAYVGYGRLAVVHHLNPHVATQLDLVRLGDPTAPYLHWPISSPYGALWTLISMLPVAVAPASLWTEVVIMKLFAAAALLMLALGGRRLAECLAPGRGQIAFAVLILNPLLLVEGAGNAHSDMVIGALVVWALAAAAERRPLRALSFVGLGAAIKLVPVILVPWFVVKALRRRAGVVFVLAAIVATVGPAAASYAPFWRGAETLRGLLLAWKLRNGGGAGWQGPVAAAAAYALLSAWVVTGADRRAVAGWVAASTVPFLFVVGLYRPWYFVWPFAAVVALQDRRGWVVAGLVFCFAAALTLRYAASS